MDTAIYNQLKETAQKLYYMTEKEPGICEIEIPLYFREDNTFLLQTAYEHRNKPGLLHRLEDKIYESYDDIIWGAEETLLREAGFDMDEDEDLYDRAEEVMYETFYFVPNYEHFLKKEVNVNLLIGSEKELDGGLMWLLNQQGYTLEDLREVKEAYDTSYYGTENETSRLYASWYLDFRETHSKFLTSLCQELENLGDDKGCLAILAKTSLDEYCKLFERSTTDESLIPKELVFDKTIDLGIFNPWNGSGSCFVIELEKDLVLPNNLIFDVQIEGCPSSHGHSVEEVYGCDYASWKRIKEIREPEKELKKDALTEQIQDAASVMESISSERKNDFLQKER